MGKAEDLWRIHRHNTNKLARFSPWTASRSLHLKSDGSRSIHTHRLQCRAQSSSEANSSPVCLRRCRYRSPQSALAFSRRTCSKFQSFPAELTRILVKPMVNVNVFGGLLLGLNAAR
ncbi:hypothetical protein F441_04009 [Phytophthora nicotianae CJ01A1]|uniref:Uncharacterized protein n=5 Tax=Phytophthora nicotianae TaxID=4792 RepID=V9FRD2_PHYNI|nr:hypothetical protein F443_04027 [Phytophthora nicotianae P1569]ETK92809.1 hypothetical protein L915_03912 [Phytophthora nicotianae]ETO81644.1 hypothetical protein F444_04086 [Phytophthora nicotianae P1976]ETP22750.1 hypothetical protein F441_04009 [Phytophthora nicotianae CJ01A1]ETP50742.1 hypothetical protein F442_04013 [Phytophthora nicotianae P10297]